VVPPVPVLRWIDSSADSVSKEGDGLRWTRTDQRHITLQFLGPVPDPVALAESVAESFRRAAPFSLVLGGAGAFPSARKGSVLWIGVDRGSEALADVAARVMHATEPLGFEPDDRPYRPHLTLARARRPQDLRELVAALDACEVSPHWTVDDVVLFDSETNADGAVHVEQARFRLAG
jgi:2'-5' RNA ligase